LKFRKSRRPVTLSRINLPVRSRKRVTLTWANLPIRGKVLVVVAIPLCALLAAAVAYYVHYRADIQAEEWVAHSQDVRIDIQEALIFLLDAETGMRGYLLTGQDLFLRRYEKAAQALPKDVAELERLVQDQPTQIARMRRTASLVQEQLRTLAAFRPSPTLAGTAAVRQDALMLQSAGIMDAVRRELDGMLAEEERLLAQRERQSEDANKGILIAIGLSLLVGLSSGITATSLFARAIGGRVRRLEENAGQLARGLPLTPWSPSNDEIGHLAEGRVRWVGHADEGHGPGRDGAGGGRSGQPGQDRLPVTREPRTAYPSKRHPRFCTDSGDGQPHGRASGQCGADPQGGAAPAHPDR
jgi:CHASE3 domain sensor protein